VKADSKKKDFTVAVTPVSKMGLGKQRGKGGFRPGSRGKKADSNLKKVKGKGSRKKGPFAII